MSVETLLQVGMQSGLSGKAIPSMSKYGSAIVQDDFAAAVERGRCFIVCSQSGITTQAGLSATTPALTLANAAGSGVRGRLWYAGATFTVAAATAGAVWLAVGTNTVAAAVTGTLTTAHRNCKLGGTTTAGNKIDPFLAATLPAAPVGVALLGSLLTGAITTQMVISSVGRWFYGAMTIEPGTNVSIQTGVASGASGTFCEFIWEELDA